MNPEGLLNLKLTASQDDSRYKLDLRISWQVEDKALEEKTLTISSS